MRTTVAGVVLLLVVVSASCAAEYEPIPKEWPPRAEPVPSKSIWSEIEKPVKVIGGIVLILTALGFTFGKKKR